MFGVEDFEQRRRGVAAKIAAELINLVEQKDRIAGAGASQALDDSADNSDGYLVCSPNPFNARIQIGFRLEQQSQVTIVVYDTRGRQVASLLGGIRADGYHEVTWDAGTTASGTYFLVLTTKDRRLVRKLSLVK